MFGNAFFYFYQKCHISFENKLFDGYQKRKIEISVFQIAASVAYFFWRIFPNSPLAMVKSSIELFSFSRSLPFVLSIRGAVDLVARRPSRVLYSLHAATFALKLLHPSLMRVSHRNPPEQMANTACSRVKTRAEIGIRRSWLITNNAPCRRSDWRALTFAKSSKYLIDNRIGYN